MSEIETKHNENSKNDAIATTGIITIVILVVIHSVQTGGLPAFFARFF